ncbi:hypothetical protein C3B58_01275 [Lactonifactor longoviformis]|uniref:LPXTG-motif cell wall anchor domain-containing protein n=1 Tax=Lactonifactor longoviformis DSM 17459 TaxID=1122155 RepID=A0A1M4VXP9_9CLOT|nr:hypothetical protein [Lactonifactor longoviformis]POP34795.1 hypothetical protein C3B58_01275 [Lactonifactor longoviformis]SHE73726.1 hypothetical protein SAMN02745158_01382 [Lactonifactor longoviformis DSM 17459]
MIKKNVFSVVLAALLVLGTATTAMAADEVITFTGDAAKFVTEQEAGTGEGFTNMEPAETRTQTITLKNDDYQQMKFYLRTELLSNIADEGKNRKQAIYTVDLSKDGENFFAAVIGSEQNASLGKEFLVSEPGSEQDNNILLASLKKGESVDVEIAITLDGDSTGNDYQEKDGQIQLIVSVEKDEGTPGKIRKTVTNTKTVTGAGKTITKVVKTGDEFPVEALLVLAGLSLVCIVLAAAKRKKKVEE